MAKKKISKSELKLKEIQYAWKMAHYKPKKIVLRRNAIDECSMKLKEHVNQSQKMKIQEMIKAINKLSDKYPPSVSNSNQKIWRPWE